MYPIADTVGRWRSAGKPVLMARLVDLTGMAVRWPGEVAAFSPGEPVAGGLLAGAADDAIAARLAALESDGTELVTVDVGDGEARAAGLACGGHARLLVQPADAVPGDAWHRLRARQPVALLTELDSGATRIADEQTAYGEQVASVLSAGRTGAAVVNEGGRELLVAAYWPTPVLLVVGEGLLADALGRVAGLLGWDFAATNDATSAAERAAGLGDGDALVVLSHDHNVDVPVLVAALGGHAGYLGGLGSQRTQARRREQLAERGIDPGDRLHGPAGLDVGAGTPGEVAVAIAAEILAVRTGAPGGSLRNRPGPVHR